MAPPLLFLQSVQLTLGGNPLLDGVELAVARGDKISLVGRNGSGKSTMLKIAAGEIEMDKGTRFVQPGTSVRYLPQEPDLSAFASVMDYVMAGQSLDEGDPYRARYLLEQLGLGGDELPASLSGGEARRAALVRVLAPEPDILLLDEPTNHLDLPAIEWLESELASLRSAIVLISHDRRFLTNLTRATVWLDRGQTRRLDRGFGAFEAWRDEVMEMEEKEAHKLDRKIVAEEHWVRYGVTARRKRNMGRMERLSGLRQERREQRRSTGDVKMTVVEGKTSGALVVEAKAIAKAWGERPIVRDFSTRILRGDRVGIIGQNGAGKTTLIKLLTGDLTPDSGTVRLGANLQIASLDQRRSSLSPETLLKDALTGGGSDNVILNGQPRHVIGYMKDFLFAPEQARTPVGRLSGGERGRLTLARALALPSNFLVLDEPTNDLDLETLDLLQEMIADYPGTVMVVSHDRDFLDRVATSVIVTEGDGVWMEYAGGYSDMVAQRGFGVVSTAPFAAKMVPETAPTRLAGQGTVSSAPSNKKRMSFKHKHALETLPARMDTLRAKMASLQYQLDDSSLYTRDPKAFERITASFVSAQKELEKCENDWLELELAREEAEAG